MVKISEAYRQMVQELETIYEPGEAKAIARILFEDGFGIRNTAREEELTAEQKSQLARFTSRLLRHEPVQYVLDSAQFYGLTFKVGPEVLIPRQETEELVYWILGTLDKKPLRLLDIGSGSGCIPVVLKDKRPMWQCSGIDISEEALQLARENAALNRVEIDFLHIDILDEKQCKKLGRFEAIVSNPPYIPDKEAALMPENVKRFEPRRALFVEDDDPLLFYRRITEFAKQHLTEGGWLFFETNEYNAGEVSEVVERQGFGMVELKKDLNGKKRMLRACRDHSCPPAEA